MTPDPLPVLRIWGVRVTLDGVVYEIPKLSAADWIEAILAGEVVPALLGPAVADRITLDRVKGKLDDTTVRTATRQAMADAAGRNWWEVYRLVKLGEQAPDMILGGLVRDGFDFEARPIGAYCAAVVSLITEHMDKKDREKFILELGTAPLDVAAEEGDEALSAAFMAAMAGAQ